VAQAWAFGPLDQGDDLEIKPAPGAFVIMHGGPGVR